MATVHHFDIEHAKKYGVNEAILISNLHFWVSHNYANDTNQHDGRTWTYNSVKAFADLFPYLSGKQIRSSLDHLVLVDVLLRGNYNVVAGDRTSWFAFTDSFLADHPLPISRAKVAKKPSDHLPSRANAVKNEPDHLPWRANAFALQGKSLTSTDINTDGERAKALEIPLPLFLDYQEIRATKNAGPLTNTAIEGLKDDARLAGITVKQAVTACVKHSWASFVPAWYAERTGAAPSTPSAPAKGKAQPGEANYIPPVSDKWHESLSGVASKAAELGLKPRDEVMETAPAFKARVIAAAKKRGAA